jgi:hypothetical protein
MSFTYDPVNNIRIAAVRMLIADTNPAQPIFQDEEINLGYTIQASVFQSSMFYSGPSGQTIPSTPISYLRVSAIMLDAMASNQAYLAGIKSIPDVQMSAGEAAKALMDKAKKYREMDDESASFFIYEQVFTTWGFTSRFWSQIQRQTGN